MSLRRETKTRRYYSWVGYQTKREAQKEASEYRRKGQKCLVSKSKTTGLWHCWRWHTK